jgi:hypothetical protein
LLLKLVVKVFRTSSFQVEFVFKNFTFSPIEVLLSIWLNVGIDGFLFFNVYLSVSISCFYLKGLYESIDNFFLVFNIGLGNLVLGRNPKQFDYFFIVFYIFKYGS